MKPTVYVETTIPSYLVARASKLPRLQADQATTRQWWSQHAADFDMFVSDVVIREVRRGDAAMAEERLAKPELCSRGVKIVGFSHAKVGLFSTAWQLG